ncbi:MAG: hypothetical protein WCJ31_18455, partial [Planctomycetia bacterium]
EAQPQAAATLPLKCRKNQFMRQIRFDDLEDGVFQFKHFQVVEHRHRIAASREITTAKFI